jgi:RNA polymerase subunit RPABC4/transcription elongation factor Spt4
MPECVSCKASLTEADRFCPNCGKGVELPAMQKSEEQPLPAPRHCSNCGALLEAGAKFCAACGHPVGASKTIAHLSAIEAAPSTKSFWSARKNLILVLSGLVLAAAAAAALLLTNTIHIGSSALKETRERANKGDVAAQFELARAYHDGLGVKQDLAAAADWFERAAQQKDVRAEYNLGLIYLNGQGRERSEAQAATWIKAAADANYAPAQTTLGMLYKQGTGVSRDDSQGAAWLLKAAKQGYRDAQSLVGLLYVTGDGVAQNYVEGYRWLTLATRQGDTGAAEQLDAITKVMTLDQLATAAEFAKQPASAANDIAKVEHTPAPTPAPTVAETPAFAAQTPPPTATPLPVAAWTAAPSPTPSEDLKQFIEEQWRHSRGNDPYQFARDFARNADYCYTRGNPSDLRSFIAQDRTKFVDRYPNRNYSSVQMDLKMISPDYAQVTYNYDYSYRGSSKSARGHCRQVMMIEKISNQWQITKFDEQVQRY